MHMINSNKSNSCFKKITFIYRTCVRTFYSYKSISDFILKSCELFMLFSALKMHKIVQYIFEIYIRHKTKTHGIKFLQIKIQIHVFHWTIFFNSKTNKNKNKQTEKQIWRENSVYFYAVPGFSTG